MGFYSEFEVDYTKFNETAEFSPSGSDLKFCFKNTTFFSNSHKDVYVTDLLARTTVWPTSPNDGPLTPTTDNLTLYNSPNGFNTTFKQKSGDVNSWCLSSSNFGKFIEPFKGQASFKLGISASLESFYKCTDQDATAFTVFFENNGGELTISTGGKTKSKVWMWILIVVVVVVVVGGGVFFYLKKSGDGGGFSKV